MAIKFSKSQEFCPFWSVQTVKCQLGQGGIFIPLDDHIEVYCKTEYFPQCMQYILHSEDHIQLMDISKKVNLNRRKYERIEACYKVTLVKLAHSGQIVSHISTIGRTLDLSQGGMRLAMDKPLVSDTVVGFSLEGSFPRILQAGKGQVAWCSKEIDGPGYQAGISFQDDQIIDAMGLYLGLHTADS